MDSLILYNYFRSSTSYRVRIALHHKKLAFEYKAVHLLNNGGEQNAEDYKILNPMSEVPTLIHKGNQIGQSLAIIEYLDEVFPQAPLFPKDPVRKAKVRQFCENINSFMHPLGNLKVLQYLETRENYDAHKKAEWVSHWNTRGYKALERVLEQESGSFCFGDQITAADLFLIPQMFASARFNVDLAPFSRCVKINEHCLKQEAFIKAHPFRQPDTPDENRLK